MPRKQTETIQADHSMVTFEFQDRTYQIDTQQRKVYRRFVEIETAKAAEIYSVWRDRRASA